MTLLHLGVAWLVGITLAAWLDLPLPVCVILAMPALAGLLLWRREPAARRVAVCALVLLAGGARVATDRPRFGPGDLPTYNDLPDAVTVVGVVAADPEVHDTYQTLLVRSETLAPENSDGPSQTLPVSGWLEVQTPRYPPRAYGDRLSLAGRITTPPVLGSFSYRDYLARQHIYSQMRFPRVQPLDVGQGNPFWSTLYSLRQRLAATASRILPEPMAALLTAILLGVRTGIPRAVYDQFNTTGTSHIIVISGSNIVIICGLLLRGATRTVGRRWAPWITLVGVVGYTLLVGADAPVFRAALTGGLGVLALHFGRQTEARTSLVLAAVLMTAINPGWLGDSGFQLSFGATAGLIWLVPPFERAIAGWFNRPSGLVGALRGLVGEGFVVTLAAQLATLPLIAYHFSRISPVSLIANMLILPMQPMVMLTGAAAMTAGIAWLPAGRVLGWIAWLPLAWTVLVVERLSTLDPGLVMEQGSGWLGAGLAGALLGVVVLMTMRRAAPAQQTNALLPRMRTSTRVTLIAGLLVTTTVWLAAASLPDGRLHVAFLDVGQGDAILITTPRGAQILVDGGPGGGALLTALGRHMPFWDRSLDLVINTHPEADHLTGLLAVLERYQISQVMVPEVESRSSLYAAWVDELRRAGIAPIPAQAGSQVSTQDGVRLEVLHPDDMPADEPMNNHSIVLYVALGMTSFLLTGDIEADVEHKIVARYGEFPVSVLKAPHHGSLTSSSLALLRAARPKVVVISVGAKNELGLPADEVVKRYTDLGAQIMRTDQVGTVEFTTDGVAMSITTERQATDSDQSPSIAPPPVLQ
jgi:competence protein ComEC